MTNYLVNDMYSTVQGEGVQTGVAMVLLRLHGCGVGCSWCDTKETWVVDEANRVATLDEALGANPHYWETTASEIADAICTRYPGPKWVLITGGEPAAYDLKPLTACLQARHYRVALETSGTEIGHVGAGIDWVCVSPKVAMPGGKAVRPEAIVVADEIKYVVGKAQDVALLDTLLTSTQTKETVQICLQPLSTNHKATALCVQTVKERGWRLSIQLHKYIDQR